MKRILALLFLFALLSPARAGVPCALPFNLQNGTPADATQVMANYNAIITCLGNAAAAGNNSDITALTGLAAPLSPTNGGTPVFIAPTPSTGSGNAQIVSTTVPTGFALTPGYTVVFTAGASNSGLTTLQVGSASAISVYRSTEIGAVPAVGGEIISGNVVAATYDGAHFQLLTHQSVPIGTVLLGLFANADPGFVLMQGQCLSTTGIYNSLWTKIGSPGSGACGAGQFQMADGRGRFPAAIDSGGSNRITAAGGNFDGTVLENSGGVQNKTLTLNELPAHSHTINDPGHVHAPASGGNFVTDAAGAVFQVGVTGHASGNATTASATTGITVNSTGSGNLFSILPPTLMVNMEIKY